MTSGAGAMVATAMRVVNAVPYVVAAEPGLLSSVDLPLTIPKHAFRRPSAAAGRVTFNPLEELTLAQLQLRTSMKWRAHPADVLPLWVAEMDVKLPPTVADALRRAIDIGDTGYPSGTALAEAVSEFASRRWEWHDFEVSRTAIVPDVMLGIVETLRLITDPVTRSSSTRRCTRPSTLS